MVSILIRSTLLLSVLLGGYYVWIGFFDEDTTGEFAEISEALVRQKSDLLVQQIAMTELLYMDVQSQTFYNDLAENMQKLSEYQSVTATQLFEGEQISDGFEGDLRGGYDAIISQYPGLISGYAQLDSKMSALFGSISKVMEYQLFEDISLGMDSDVVVNRLIALRKGVVDTKSSVQLVEVVDTSGFESRLESVVAYIDALGIDQDINGKTLTQEQLNELAGQLDDVKVEGLSMVVEVLKIQDMVDLITIQSNLILEYDYWVKRIAAY